jgi:hypothetical protein
MPCEPKIWRTLSILQGVGLRATKWDRLFRSEDGADLIFPILALCGGDNGGSLLGIEPGDEGRIMAEAATLLPDCAMAIDDYWRLAKADTWRDQEATPKRSLPLRLPKQIQEVLRQVAPPRRCPIFTERMQNER